MIEKKRERGQRDSGLFIQIHDGMAEKYISPWTASASRGLHRWMSVTVVGLAGEGVEEEDIADDAHTQTYFGWCGVEPLGVFGCCHRSGLLKSLPPELTDQLPVADW